MAYRHYDTEGLIIGQRNLGEANRLYQILTRDFGLINVLAQGVRRDRSKLRYHLGSLSFVHLTLVRGREFWRVVGVGSLDEPLKPSKSALILLKKISLVLKRLIQGEEKNSGSFDDLLRACRLILEQPSPTVIDLANLEIFVLARLLTQLGYLAPIPELKPMIIDPNFSWVEVRQISPYQTELIKQINQALEVTQL